MEDKSYNYPEFDLPEGYPLPEGAAEKGDEFDAMVVVRLKEDGRACFVSIDGVPLGEPKASGTAPVEDDELGFMDSMSQSMG